jgi:hypothetical protein
MATAARVDGMLPFPYPPPFMFVVAPFAFFSYPVGFVLWVFATGAFYLWIMRSEIALAHPCVITNGMIGQNAFLTVGVFAAGIRLLDKRPILAGAILGLLSIKPQLAVLIPVALLACGNGRALCGAVLCVLGVHSLGLLFFGVDAYRGFLAALPMYSTFAETGRWPWSELASVYAFARWFGANHFLALILQAAIAANAALLVWLAWRVNARYKVELLAAATLLVSPYLFTYDGLLLAIPFAAAGRRSAIAFGLVALPVVSGIFELDIPNTMPLAALAILVELADFRRGKDAVAMPAKA